MGFASGLLHHVDGRLTLIEDDTLFSSPILKLKVVLESGHRDSIIKIQNEYGDCTALYYL